MKPTVMVDVDDTIADTQHAFIAYLEATGRGGQYTYAGITRAMRENHDAHYRELVWEFLTHSGTLANLRPLPGCLAALRRLVGAGYAVHITTSRTIEASQLTRNWLEHHGVAELATAVHLRPAEATRNGFKVDMALAIKAVAAFDDAYDAALALAEANVWTYLLTRPWNAKEPLPAGAQRAASFPGAVTQLLASRH
jgi:phosphoglycolate phosphatase-like HAD superfamily hydrolase